MGLHTFIGQYPTPNSISVLMLMDKQEQRQHVLCNILALFL